MVDKFILDMFIGYYKWEVAGKIIEEIIGEYFCGIFRPHAGFTIYNSG